jgi:hypothetical protein
MTTLGIIHLGSLIYLSGVICFSVSLNENRQPKRILRETLRRWIKFLGITLVIALAVHLMSR